MTRFRITKPAQDDIDDILATSLDTFGEQAKQRYDQLILTAIREVVSQPTGIGRKPRPELGHDVYQYYLTSSRDRVQPPKMRVKQPRHYLIYRLEDDGNPIAFGRVLHDRALPAHYLNADTWN